MDWLQARLNSLLDNLIFTFLLSGGAVVIALIKGLPVWSIILIALGVFACAFLIIRLVSHLYLMFIIRRLISVGIFTDVRDNILRILYHDRDSLKIGLPDKKVLASELDKLAYGDLRTHNIVQLEQRSTGSYWILTELGKRIILYLEKNPQVLHKEGSRHK